MSAASTEGLHRGDSARVDEGRCDYYSTPGDDQPHDEFCPHARLDISRGAFVDAAEGGAKAAIETYLWCINDEKMSHGEALEQVIVETQESAACFAGIGSCGRGWCKHS